MPDGAVIAAYLPREDVRDALISALANSVVGLPRGRHSAPPRFALRSRLCAFAVLEFQPGHLLWRLVYDQSIRTFGHTGAVTSVAFSPDGGSALSGGDNKTLRL